MSGLSIAATLSISATVPGPQASAAAAPDRTRTSANAKRLCMGRTSSMAPRGHLLVGLRGEKVHASGEPFGGARRPTELTAIFHLEGRPSMRVKQTTMKLLLALAFAGVTVAPALACMTTPYQIWPQIDAALPKTELSDADLERVKALRAKAFEALLNQRVAGKFAEAVQATNEAIRIVGLVPVEPRGGAAARRQVPPSLGCGTAY